jgi:hypothetical protein
MQDALLKLRSSYAYKTNDNTGTVTSNAADAAITDASANTGFKQIKWTNRIPYRPLVLEILMPGVSAGGGITTTGGPTPVAIVFTVTYSTDGTNAVGGSVVSKSVSVTIASNAGTAPGELYLLLGAVTYVYLKAAWVTTMTGGSTPTTAWGLLDISLIQNPSSIGGTMIN